MARRHTDNMKNRDIRRRPTDITSGHTDITWKVQI